MRITDTNNQDRGVAIGATGKVLTTPDESTTTLYSSASAGAYLDPASPALGGSAVYNYAADPGAFVPAVLWDSQGGSTPVPLSGATRPLIMVPDVLLTNLAPGTDFTWAVFGLDSLPGAGASWNDYRKLARPVVPEMHEGESPLDCPVGVQEFLHVYRYYIAVICSTAVAPGGNVSFGFRAIG